MTLQNQVRAWLIIFAVTIVLLWLFRGILLPFVVGMALAYLLDPVADKLEEWKFNRALAVSLIMAVMVLLVVGLLLLLVPLIVQQLMGLLENLPGYLSQLRELSNQWVPELYQMVGEDRMQQIQASLSDLFSTGMGIVGAVSRQIMQSGLAVINALGLLVVTPVVAFYLLLDWDRMVEAGDKLLPRKRKQEIRDVMAQINVAMSAVIRGQVSVVLLLAAFYGTALSLAGLSFGLAIGLIAGLLSFIPYVGFLVGFVLSIGVAFVQFWPDWIMIAVIFVIFAFGQFLEGNVLYPKLVGSSIGVHPVWLMFALFAFGLIFGFVGLLLAVPMAAVASVLARYLIGKYKQSSLYTGGMGPDDETPVA